MAAEMNWTRLTEPWPDPASLADIQGVPVSWPSSSPFAIEDIGGDPDDAPPTTALGRFYLPPGPHAARSVPAVVLLHGSGGVLASRELTYAAQVADKLAPPLPNGERLRFAGHVAFYGPCIARFDDSRTTGAPLLMLIGGRDAITDQGRCAEIAADLRRGGSRVDTIVYPEAVH